MKLSIKEIIKRIKILEDELIVLNQEEDKDNYVIYLKDEKVEKSTYDFDKTNKKRQEINQEILSRTIEKSEMNSNIFINNFLKEETIFKIKRNE